jgi:hypothetical protein
MRISHIDGLLPCNLSVFDFLELPIPHQASSPFTTVNKCM